jgi:OHCU decarboxylase
MSRVSSWCHSGLSETLAWFNALAPDEAEVDLLRCCGSRAWASAVAAQRPYADLAALMENADNVWSKLGRADWLEAFAAHPRLGESGGHAPQLSETEQSGMTQAGDETRVLLAEENRRYETRFGRVFLFSAAGHTAADVLSALHSRMSNTPESEVKEAAEEQRKITRLRLGSMLHE